MRSEFIRGRMATLTGLALVLACALTAQAARERKVDPSSQPAAGDKAAGEQPVSGAGTTQGAIEARRLFENAQELMRAKQTDRALAIYSRILEQYPTTQTVYPTSLELGRYYLSIRDQVKALPLLARIKTLEQPGKELTGDEREWFLESLYLTGVAHFQNRRFADAFQILRKITVNYSGSLWANQAYYYIGMCHFAQENWSKAIEALNMVGAFMDPNSATADNMEAGRRFYLRVEDRDLPLLARLGKTPKVIVTTSNGDREQCDSVPLNLIGTVIGSLPTIVGVAKPGDGTLQIVSGATITSTYTDEISETGSLNVARTSTVHVVSSGTLALVLGDFETTAVAAYQDQPCFMMVFDADLDVSDAADTAEVSVISRYKKASESEDVLNRPAGEEAEYVTRDQVKVQLTELGTNAPIRVGRFGGKVDVVAYHEGDTPSQSDSVLACAAGDELVATYNDALSIGGAVARSVSISLPVLGKANSDVESRNSLVFDPVLRAKKNLVEGSAFLELARIFRSMGLIKGAKEKVSLGLDRSQDVMNMTDTVPVELRQQAYKLTWELQVAGDDLTGAMATCGTFNRLFPDSSLVDEALVGMGNIHRENRKYAEAIDTFRKVLALTKSQAKGEAHFRVGEALEAQGEAMLEKMRKMPGGNKSKNTGNPMRSQAIQEYKLCAQRYPDPPFGPLAVAKVVDYYIESQDYAQATALLEQVFVDYPDQKFLDAMLLKWVIVAFASSDFSKARDKCNQLIADFPDSPQAAKAKKILPQIEAKLNSGAAAAAAGETSETPKISEKKE